MLPTPISWQEVLSTWAPAGTSCRARWLASSWLQIDSAVRLGSAWATSGHRPKATRARVRAQSARALVGRGRRAEMGGEEVLATGGQAMWKSVRRWSR